MASIALRRLEFAAAGYLTVFAFVTPEVSAGQQPPSAKDLATVIEMLHSPDPVVRVSVACARDVFNASAAPAIPALVELLEDAEPVAPEVCREDHRRWWGDEQPITPGEAAARALVHIGSASFDPLVKAVASPAAAARPFRDAPSVAAAPTSGAGPHRQRVSRSFDQDTREPGCGRASQRGVGIGSPR